jgi:hypothetical protein
LKVVIHSLSLKQETDSENRFTLADSCLLTLIH